MMRCWTPDRPWVVWWLGSAVLAVASACPCAAAVRLVEVVAANDGAWRDEEGESADWIEIHNAGATAVSLDGWGLSDRAEQPFKWVFPSRLLPAGARLVVFASGKNRKPATGWWHTNFSIAADGEPLVLTAPDGAPADAVPAVRLMEGVSYGRAEAEPGHWRFFASPSPGQPNTGESWAELLIDPPVVSAPGGFYDDPITLVLAPADAGIVVRYTLDGSEPSQEAPVLPADLVVRSRAGETNWFSEIQGTAIANQHTDGWKPPLGEVRKATIVRLRGFKPDARPSPTVTHTYFIGPAARHPDRLPVVSLATAPDGLFDYTRGIYMLGKTFDDYVAAHPDEPLTGHTPANYTQRGPDWSREASMEFFEPDGTRVLAQPVRLDIKGQSTRSFRQKSFGLEARDAWGGRDAFRHSLFPGRRRMGDGQLLDSFRTLRLRNMGNDWAYAAMRDGISHRLADGLGLVHMAWRPVSVYLDGEYWGISEMREELDADYVAAHFGIAREEVVIVNAPGSVVEGQAGDHTPFVALRTFAESHDLADPEPMAHVAARMDVDDFLRYQFLQVWCGNADWPHNNTRAWRRRLVEPPAQSDSVAPGHDGRWRWMVFDLDLAMAHPWAGGAGENTLAMALSPTGRPPINAPWATSLLRALMGNPQVKRRFASLAADMLNSQFVDSRVTALVDATRAALEPAMPDHIRRWQPNGNSVDTWANIHVQRVRNFASQRTINVRQHFTIELQLGGYATLTADVTPPTGGVVTINDHLRVDSTLAGVRNPVYPWRGTYFRQVPVTVAAEPAAGYLFAGWSTPGGDRPERRIEMTLEAATTVTARFVAAPGDAPMHLRVGDSLADGRPRLAFQGAPGAAYALERSHDLRQWQRETSFLADAAGRHELTPAPVETTGLTTPSCYYRIVVP